MKATGYRYKAGEICVDCDLNAAREQILAHPGWTLIELGNRRMVVVFSSWGNIEQFCMDRADAYSIEDICDRCGGKGHHTMP